MWSRRTIAVCFLLGLLAMSALFGCRAFQPEVIIVNKPPQTYIVGAPAETSGGYYHFHLYWYGTDADGEVTKFVWALTDTSVQDHDIEGDEEDQRFNPATNATTLQIGHYTVRTDTVFDFEINQGSNLAYNKTFHLVAVDDRGDFDRTPARLRFITNAVGNPTITFYRSRVPEQGPVFANFDTIGYGQPFEISWSGQTPNIRSYSPELLAARDTVPPVDGLYGYKFRLLDIPCNDTTEDCWQPREFDAVAGDSVSYFGMRNWLAFTNDNSGPGVYQERLPQGIHRLLVNTRDMAGVEVPQNRQALNYVINYDPDTRLLRGETDPFFPSDPKVYPYYIVFHSDGTTSEHTFAEGDTIPDKSYVVFKAIGWDDPRDVKTGTAAHEVNIQGAFEAVGKYGGSTPFAFATQFSAWPHPPGWERPAAEGGGAADTLGFLVGPYRYTVTMRAVDEWGRRDGTPERFTFYANFPPCVQCAELLVGADPVSPSSSFTCNDAACAADVDTIYAKLPTSPTPVPPDWRAASLVSSGLLWYNARTGAVWLDTPTSTVEPDSMPGYFFEYMLAMHGADHPLETWNALRPQDRIPSWNYAIESERDAGNVLSEGGGIDDLGFTTFEWEPFNPLAVPPQPIAVDDDGVWLFRFKFFVPENAMAGGEANYIAYLRDARQLPNYLEVYRLTTLQMGVNTAYFRANDASNCTWNPMRSRYHYYTQVRVPTEHGLNCNLTYIGEAGNLRLEDFRFSSPQTFEKRYVIKVVPNFGPIFPE